MNSWKLFLKLVVEIVMRCCRQTVEHARFCKKKCPGTNRHDDVRFFADLLYPGNLFGRVFALRTYHDDVRLLGKGVITVVRSDNHAPARTQRRSVVGDHSYRERAVVSGD